MLVSLLLDGRLDLQLHSTNPGLPYIRRLEIAINRSTRLHEFDTCEAVSPEISYILRLTQRKLSNLILHLAEDPSHGSLLPDANELRNVTSLSVHLSSFYDVDRAAEVLRQARAVTSLSLVATNDFRDLPGNSTLRCMETLFADWQHGKTKLNIKRLECDNFDLEEGSQTIVQALTPKESKELSLDTCRNTNHLMKALREGNFTLTTLINVRTLHYEDDLEDEEQEYLAAYKGLSELRVTTITESELPPDFDWSAVQAHGDSLRTLFVDDFHDENQPFRNVDHNRSMEGLATLFRHCKRLDQLAIRTPSPDASPQQDDVASFSMFLECLKPLANLRTLRLFVYLNRLDKPCGYGVKWPEPEATFRREAAEWYMKKLADDVFSTLHDHCPHFVALVMDAREPSMNVGYGDNTKYCKQSSYFRAMQSNLYGQTTATAVACELKSIRAREAYCEIFNDEVISAC
ncbi:hypothetical protein LTR22_021772 [Elasticomyces elasticus]|nr:hypothetical protein LTR22_021772 [Elasticomyces elasticus]KAK5749356.1 hypothetical protein LTS12_020611 [Elasticomyces elasticus]